MIPRILTPPKRFNFKAVTVDVMNYVEPLLKKEKVPIHYRGNDS
jgi:hypothetical protein